MSSQKSEAEITREEDERHHVLDFDSEDNFSEGSAEAHSELAGVRPMLWNGRLPQRSFTGPAVSAGSSEYYLEEELSSWMQGQGLRVRRERSPTPPRVLNEVERAQQQAQLQALRAHSPATETTAAALGNVVITAATSVYNAIQQAVNRVQQAATRVRRPRSPSGDCAQKASKRPKP